MKNYQKYIFDLDYTLLIPDWSKEDDYLSKKVPKEEQLAFFKQKQDILNQYEATFPKYDLKTLSAYFKKNGFSLSEKDILGWMIHNGETIKDEVADGVIELFDYLKSTGKEIVVLTNWFGGTQIPRLKRTGLYNYLDALITGEIAMKPTLASFEAAIGSTPKEDCIMIGDSIKSDLEGSKNAGIDCYLVDKSHSIRDFFELVKENTKK